MTIRLRTGDEIALQDACPVEDAATLLEYLVAAPGAIVDWSACDSAHTAVIQILIALRPTVRGRPRSPFLLTFIAPLVQPPQLDSALAPAAGVN